ncbi:hypothetical protein SCHPADRAFT_938104 [Schizopora paradoxa]|uniref:Uncharacterized protein n=1 Tax=Schizopora paradoxa TaxID=27342 RepID=A0A0H2S365_9AGAM|nr:hypothetical protein SCHPADRAFT_938104 [Schizopora paradoxa]
MDHGRKEKHPQDDMSDRDRTSSNTVQTRPGNSRGPRSGTTGMHEGHTILPPGYKRERKRIKTNPAGERLATWASSSSPGLTQASGAPNPPTFGHNMLAPENFGADFMRMQPPIQQEHRFANDVTAYAGGYPVEGGGSAMNRHPSQQASSSSTASASIPSSQQRPRRPSITIPQSTPSYGNIMTNRSQCNQPQVQGMVQGQTGSRNDNIAPPCLALFPMFTVEPCDRGCGQYLALHNGQARGHISKEALISLFQDLCGRNELYEEATSPSQEQSPSEELAAGVENMGFGSQNSQWTSTASSPTSSHYNYSS